MRLAAIRALEIRDEADIIRDMTHAELEAGTLEAERAQASAPPDVSRQLRLTAQAEADARQQSADAALHRNETQAANAQALADRIAAERQQLEAVNARYEQWSAATASIRETAAKARAELKRRGLGQRSSGSRQPYPETGPPGTAARQPEPDDGVAADYTAGREHQAAALADELRPPERTAEPESTPQDNSAAAREPDSQLGSDHQTPRLDELLTQTAEAAGRIAADNNERQARAEFTARLEREAQAQPEPTSQTQAQYDVEMEL
jgi:hypothetical protein